MATNDSTRETAISLIDTALGALLLTLEKEQANESLKLEVISRVSRLSAINKILK